MTCIEENTLVVHNSLGLEANDASVKFPYNYNISNFMVSKEILLPPSCCSYWDHKDAQENQWRHKKKNIFLVKQYQGRLNDGGWDYTDLSHGKRKRTGHTVMLAQYNLPICNSPEIRCFKSQTSLNTFVFNGLGSSLKASLMLSWLVPVPGTQEAILNLWLSPWIIIKKKNMSLSEVTLAPWHWRAECQLFPGRYY